MKIAINHPENIPPPQKSFKSPEQTQNTTEIIPTLPKKSQTLPNASPPLQKKFKPLPEKYQPH